MKFSTLFQLLFFLSSCNTNPSNGITVTDSSNAEKHLIERRRSKEFTDFLNKFRTLQLPLTINADDQQEISNLPFIFGSDTVFINTPYKDTLLDKIFAYGLLPDTIESFKVIWLTPTEIYLPVLTTFSKEGRKISEEELSVGRCGSDCCFTCHESIKINTYLTIYAADSISTCACDSLGPKDNTMKKYVLFKTGSIYEDGSIHISEMERQDY